MAARHLYLRDYSRDNKHPVGCIVVEADGAANEIRYAFSACSPLDKFNARVARDKASGRFKQSPTIIKTEIPKSGHEITKLVMQHIVQNNTDQSTEKSRSYLALEAAKGWLSYTENRAPQTNEKRLSGN